VSKRSINIDRLQIRLKGVSPESARAAAGDLGRELMGELATPRHGGERERTASGSPSALRRTIAARIAAAIRSAPKNSK
jgi:hypothetical protein